MSGVVSFALILASFYALPEGAKLEEPNETQKQRIEKNLSVIRRAEGEEETDRAVRDLALIGEPALGAVLARINEAEAGERLLLLAAVSRIPAAAPLLEQALQDPHPAVRAWCRVPDRKDPPLPLLAKRYLKVLAVAEEKRSEDAKRDFVLIFGEEWAHRWKEWADFWKDLDSDEYEELRSRLRDRRYANGIHIQRNRAAMEFALHGGRALGEGRIRIDASDPVFLAYLALLREENGAFYHALSALVGVGEPLAAVLEPLLEQENHDPEKLLRIISAVRPDRGRGLYVKGPKHRPEVLRALVNLSPAIFEGERLLALLEDAALADDGTVRVAALDNLLLLDRPAGAEVARKLFDLEKYGRQEFARAAKLMVRAGDLGLVAQYAPFKIPEDGSETATQLRNIRRASRMALKENRRPEIEALGEQFLGKESGATRMFGLDLVRDPKRLLAVARQDPDLKVAGYAAQRALEEGGAAIASETVACMRERELGISFVAWDTLTRTRSEEALVTLAADKDPRVARRAMHHLSILPAIDARWEARLLETWNNVTERNREEMLGALLPLGTSAIRDVFVAAGTDAIPVLRARAQSGGKIPFELDVEPFLKGADGDRLEDIGLIVRALPVIPDGIYFRLLNAWEEIPPSDLDAQEVDGGPSEQRIWLLDAMARSTDRRSVELCFDLLLKVEEPRAYRILGSLKAAAVHLPPERIAELVAVLKRHVEGEYALEDEVQPTFDPVRRRMLWGGINCLAWKRTEAGLELLCEFLLDPGLQPAAFDWKGDGRGGSVVPHWAREAMRHYSAVTVNKVFRRVLKEAEADGRLASLSPAYLLEHARLCQEGRDRGRRLNEVGLAICEVLERVPFEGRVGYEKMRALGGLKRYEEAARAAMEWAALKRARRVRAEDGYWSIERMTLRGRLYASLATRDAKQFEWVGGEQVTDPLILYIAGFYIRYYANDPAMATRYAEQAVQRTAGLYHPFRDLLAAQRTSEGNTRDALRLLDPDRTLPVRRPTGNRRFQMYLAKARLVAGDLKGARRELEAALEEDKRLLPEVLADPDYAQFDGLFAEIEADYLDYCFRWGG